MTHVSESNRSNTSRHGQVITDPQERIEMMEALYRQYGGTGKSVQNRLHFIRKKYAWIGVVGFARFIKRTLDILIAGYVLLMVLPLMALVAILIKLTDGGPVFFWQKRVGKWGKEFPFPKFRSMIDNAEAIKASILNQSDHQNSITFKMKRDPRITWIGRIIRKYSIDELPQLWSVLKGDMSIVGPRPPVPAEVSKYTLKDRRRLDVKPGLTCTWQISGRSDIPFEQQVKLDTEYIESQSLWLDIRILFKTIPAVLSGRGAY
ncbi:MAG TPA: sugar transferase [Desulfatirhabdiaceae bacterium]|nr:sugar transferase [Desulfatirhabdiaceae bacterium]